MFLRFHKYGVLLPVAYFLISGCNARSADPTAPTTLAVQSGSQSVVSAEPATLRPEFLSGLACVPTPAFGTRLVVVVSGGTAVVVRSLHFRFIDRFGVVSLPRVAPIPGPSPMTLPVSSIPPLTGIPIPGLAPPPGSPASPQQPLRFPFFLTFDCGAVSDGMLSVTVDTTDAGMPGTLQMQVRVTQ